jgi:hypothetical protein
MSIDTRPAEITMIQLETPKSTQGVFELPCGYLDEAGKLHTEVGIHEMTGAEEDMFSSKSMTSLQKYNELLARCTTHIGSITDRGAVRSIVKKLPVGDRVFLLFAIRRVTLGDEYVFNAKCPSCENEGMYNVDLSTLDIKKMSDPLIRVYDRSLPSGRPVRFRVSTGEDEARAEKFSKSEDSLSQAILMRLEQLDGAPPTLEAVKAMGWKDRQAIRKIFESVEGGVDTEVDMTCPKCSNEFKRDVEVSPSFFSPSA